MHMVNKIFSQDIIFLDIILLLQKPRYNEPSI